MSDFLCNIKEAWAYVNVGGCRCVRVMGIELVEVSFGLGGKFRSRLTVCSTSLDLLRTSFWLDDR